MKVAFIAPPHLTEYIAPFGTALMGLAHQVLEDPYHRNVLRMLHRFRTDNHRFLIIDNSMMELGTSLPLRDVLRAAFLAAPDEVILPDAYKEPQQTIDLLGESLAEIAGLSLEAFSPYRVYMAVPQGRSQGEWMDCYDEIYNLYVPMHIQTIGVPKYLAKDNLSGRIQTLQAIQDRWPNRITKHAWHLLGVWNHAPANDWSMGEPVEIARLFPWVRSVDTSLPVYGALGYSERPPVWDSMTFGFVGPAGMAKVVQACLYVRERLGEGRGTTCRE